MRYIKKQSVTQCYNVCRFFSSDSDGMKCCHPHYDDKEPYSNMIITHQNSRNGSVPDECPLRDGDIEVVYRISLDEGVKKNLKI